jgi:hypothetical protein
LHDSFGPTITMQAAKTVVFGGRDISFNGKYTSIFMFLLTDLRLLGLDGCVF